MHGPTGFSGLHALPKSGQSKGVLAPLMISPQAQPLGSLAGLSRVMSKVLSASKAEYFARIAKPLLGITPMPRQSAADGSNTSSSSFKAWTLPSGLTARG